MNTLTRTELIDTICLTDATYDCGQGNCSSSCDKCEDVLNYLLDRYDETIRADERAKVIDECAKMIATQIPTICGTSCPVECEWGTDETCVEHWKKYLLEQVKELNNDR